MEHTTIIHYPFTTLTYFIFIFSFLICTFLTCTYIVVYIFYIYIYILYSFFAVLYIAYLDICILFFYYLCPVLLLSFCCTVELLSLQQIPCMCKHTWPIKLILILILTIFGWDTTIWKSGIWGSAKKNPSGKGLNKACLALDKNMLTSHCRNKIVLPLSLWTQARVRNQTAVRQLRITVLGCTRWFYISNKIAYHFS